MLLGCALLLIFVVSTKAAAKNNALYLLAGLLLFVFGIALWRLAPKKPPTPSNRFRVLRGKKKETKREEDEC